MNEYKITFLVHADSPESACDAVLELLNQGGEPDSIEPAEVETTERRFSNALSRTREGL